MTIQIIIIISLRRVIHIFNTYIHIFFFFNRRLTPIKGIRWVREMAMADEYASSLYIIVCGCVSAWVHRSSYSVCILTILLAQHRYR